MLTVNLAGNIINVINGTERRVVVGIQIMLILLFYVSKNKPKSTSAKSPALRITRECNKFKKCKDLKR